MTADVGQELARRNGREDQGAGAAPGVQVPAGSNGYAPPAAPAPTDPFAGRLLSYLPGIYNADDFTARFLGIFEATLDPIEEQVQHQPDYFAPETAPAALVDWLAQWVGLEEGGDWPAERRRALILAAARVYAGRGTLAGLKLHLQALTGVPPLIIENSDGFRLGADARLGYNTPLGRARPFWFTVTLVLPAGATPDEELVRTVIEIEKPAGSVYLLQVVSPD